MKCARIRGSWIGLLACLWLAFGQDARADTWTRAESAHFTIFANIDQPEIRLYVDQLEAFKHLAELMLGTDPRDTVAAARFTIYLLGDMDLFKTIQPGISPYVRGFYRHCVNSAEAFAWAPQSFGADADYGLRVLQHEYAHYLMFSRMRRFYPSWYVEGFAEYLMTTKVEKGAFQVGVRNDWRTAQLSTSARWVDLDVLLDPKKFAEAAKNQKIDAGQFYAQSWLMAHYMLSDSARIRAFNEYFDLVGRGKGGAESFQAASGMTLAQLRSELNSYRRKYSALRVTVPQLPESGVKMTRLPKERGDYLLEAAALSCSGRKYGLELTEKLRGMRARHADDVRFRIELSRAELLFGDRKAARAELESITPDETTAFDVAHLLGRSYYEAAKPETEAQLLARNKASDQFLKAYALDKTNAPNLYFLSRSLDTGDTPSKSVMNAGTAAALLAPAVPKYASNAARISLRGGDRATAARVLQPFANNPHELDNAARVTAVINAIRDNEDTAAVLKKLEAVGSAAKKKQPGKDAGKESDPTSEDDPDEDPEDQ
jgi:hypothetical protein